MQNLPVLRAWPYHMFIFDPNQGSDGSAYASAANTSYVAPWAKAYHTAINTPCATTRRIPDRQDLQREIISEAYRAARLSVVRPLLGLRVPGISFNCRKARGAGPKFSLATGAKPPSQIV